MTFDFHEGFGEARHLAEMIDPAVIGPVDGRKRITTTTIPPYNAICRLHRKFANGKSGGCTAFLIGPRVLLTAGHCLYSHKYQAFPTSIEVLPGQNGDARPLGSAFAVAWHVPKAFIASRDIRMDWGVIVLERPFRGACMLPWWAPGDPALQRMRNRNTRIRIVGYPGDKPKGTMWSHGEWLRGFTATRLNYTTDTCGGQSGSPIMVGSAIGPTVIGIHTSGLSGKKWKCSPKINPLSPAGATNSGVRMTTGLIRAVRNAVLGRKSFLVKHVP